MRHVPDFSVSFTLTSAGAVSDVTTLSALLAIAITWLNGFVIYDSLHLLTKFGGKTKKNVQSKPIKYLISPTKIKNMPKTPWEIAKPILEREFLAGNIKADWKRSKVHKICAEFEAEIGRASCRER